ncbi:bifunctional methylenetetrahydrofolate dehydrogenase/methenyltetrahydrofolate cyclohydrolase FolD [Rhodococcus wratislaviensis]|uniref:bifunctional methylenetetrahydrofolate dehydrogenase/methenyltetrahydrofolate cyclohydrolase FolD n=1 Tax=Rhodococcus wratislaviensis TaxID=44752 RepID=UPI00365E1919
MTAIVIDGREIARASRARTAERVAAFTVANGYAPGLATILVGSDPASAVYVSNKRKAAAEAGLVDVHHHLSGDAAHEDVADLIDRLGGDSRVAGILLQLPLPANLDKSALIDRIVPKKDVDGLTARNQGRLARGEPGLRPCTPAGVIELLDSARVKVEGASATVIGRSDLVGHPAAELLLRRGATVTIAHSRTRDLPAVASQADILVVAAGIPGLVGADHIKKGAAVIDVGIHRTATGLSGDVRFDEAASVAGWITPVPGGVGPMTIATLLANTIAAAESAAKDLANRGIQ